MVSVFEGQILDLESIFNEDDSTQNQETYNFIEIRNKTSKFLFKTPFYRIPTSENSEENDTYFMVIRYYKIEEGERIGILEFQELEEFKTEKLRCLKTVIMEVKKPCYFQEFNKGLSKYLIVRSKISGEYEILAIKGEVIREGPFYRVLGEGPYIFKTKNIMFNFN